MTTNNDLNDLNDDMSLLIRVIQESLNKVLVGRRIRLTKTTDKLTKLLPGAEGTVNLIDDHGTVHVTWDDGSILGLVPEEDSWEIIS